MNEAEIINIINDELNSHYLGDDCAYIKSNGIVISQDSLVEGIHFKREWYTPHQLGYKSIAVNISDILASGAKPEYVTIALSLPADITADFVKEFYKGAKEALLGAEIIGGDITGSKNGIFISVTAVGSSAGRKISSRSNAKEGYCIITKGYHGSSSAGLAELLNNGNNKELINAHLHPVLEKDFSEQISTQIKDDYAMMDTSDGLADALYKIAEMSGVKIDADINKVPRLDGISNEQILFGGEDYKLVAAVPEDFVKNIPDSIIIGYAEKYDGTRLEINNTKYKNYNELKIYNHFGE